MEGQARSQLVFLLQWESRLQSCELEVGQVSRMQMHQAFSGCTSAVSGWSQWMLNKQLGWPTCVQPTHQAASSQTGYVAKALLFYKFNVPEIPPKFDQTLSNSIFFDLPPSFYNFLCCWYLHKGMCISDVPADDFKLTDAKIASCIAQCNCTTRTLSVYHISPYKKGNFDNKN